MGPWGVNESGPVATSAVGVTDQDPALHGSVSRVVYSNPENHWTVLRLAVEGRPRDVAVVGTMFGVREGEQLRVWGDWVQDPRYGRQLRATRYEVVLPATAAGIEKYLGSGMIPGIGPKTAKLLVRRFGDKTFEVIDKSPHRLEQLKGIGKKKIARLLKSWRSQTALRDTLSFLLGLGMSPALAARIHKHYGPEAAARVRANPYDLAQDVWGIGFLTADRIARQLEIAADDPARLRAGLVHTLKEARSDGHVCLPKEVLLQGATRLLGIDEALLVEQIAHLEGTGRLYTDSADGEPVYLPDLYAAERRAAEGLIELLDADRTRLPDAQVELLVRQAETRLGIELAPGQRDAVHMALASRVAVITGGPGTGKTTIVRALVHALEGMRESVALAAPTGRAAKRLSESTGAEARTIHRLLEWQPNDAAFGRDEHNPLEVDAVVLDEVSMVDIKLFDSVLRAMPHDGRLVLVGDVDQLPSVGPGAVLRDVIDSDTLPVSRLTDIFRQAEGSFITANAHRILAGDLPESPDAGVQSDFYWIEQDDPEAIRNIICRMIADRIPKAFGLDSRGDVQVLTPMHRGPLGAEGLNEMLGALLNPGRGRHRLAPGDKVMQIKNNYDKDVFNGDVGFVDRYADDEKTLLVAFDDGDRRRIRHYEPADQDQLVPAWAITIHKSQGSEYPAVVVPLHTQHYMMLRRNLVYTAVTRGKRLVVLVGSRKALSIAVGAGNVRRRHGRLAARLRELSR